MWAWTGVQTRLGWGLATIEALTTWMALVLVRWVSVQLYNHWVAPSYPLVGVVKDGRVLRLHGRANVLPLMTMALPFGIVMGLLADVWGWTLVIPERWVAFPLLLVVAGWLYAQGSVGFYNQVVVRWWEPVMIAQNRCSGDTGWILQSIGPQSLFRAITLLTFLWILIGITGLVGLVGILLIILAHRIPAGAFGVSVGVFAVVFAAFLGYWTALAVGLWFALGAQISQWWNRHRGRMIWAKTLLR